MTSSVREVLVQVSALHYHATRDDSDNASDLSTPSLVTDCYVDSPPPHEHLDKWIRTLGSYCTVYFDDVDVCSAKSAVPDDFSALFQESDRLVRTSRYAGDADPEVVYETTRDVVLARLDLLGCTSQVARERLSKWIKGKKATWEGYASGGDLDWAEETADALGKFTIEDWYARVPKVLATRHTREQYIDVIDRHMNGNASSWLWFDGYNSLVGFRAILDAHTHVKKVTRDISDLIQGGWLDADERAWEGHRSENLVRMGPLAPTVILAEGRSDIHVLKRSLSVLFPERQKYFSFFEHAELSVDGGTAYLVKFLKAFAAARVPLRLVAIFDNDTTGLQAHRQAQHIGFPENMILLRLPDVDIAREYPTIGPQGFHSVDVNGQAASIELYLGRKALTTNGHLRRVRWTGYDKAADAYQGKVESKDDVERSFFRDLDAYVRSSDARDAFPELVEVWETIFAAVEESAEAGERKTVNHSWWDSESRAVGDA